MTKPGPVSTREPYRQRLTDEQAVDIRRRHDAGEKNSALAVRFGISYQTVWQITNNRTYRSAS